MALCSYCMQDMTTAPSCCFEALHRNGVHIALAPHRPSNGRSRGKACDDCGVSPCGWHHLGCDLQRCPMCRGQLLSCGCDFDEFENDNDNDDARADDDDVSPYGVDGNGQPTELRIIDGMEVVVHYADVPESDLTTVHGIRCTNALRSMIDVACEMPPEDLVFSIRDCLQRRLFTVRDANHRLDAPDMADYRGAHLVRAALPLASGSSDDAQ